MTLFTACNAADTTQELTIEAGSVARPAVALTGDANNDLVVKATLHDSIASSSNTFVTFTFNKAAIDFTGVAVGKVTVAAQNDSGSITLKAVDNQTNNSSWTVDSSGGAVLKLVIAAGNFAAKDKFTVTFTDGKITDDACATANAVAVDLESAADAETTAAVTKNMCAKCSLTDGKKEQNAAAACYCYPTTGTTTTTKPKVCYDKTKKTTCTKSNATTAHDNQDTYACSTASAGTDSGTSSIILPSLTALIACIVHRYI